MVTTGDATIECFSVGKGDCVVLLPGGSLSVSYLADLAETLAEAGLRAVRLNPRGAGGGTGPMEGLTLHDYAPDVAGASRIRALALRSSSVTPSRTRSRAPWQQTALT